MKLIRQFRSIFVKTEAPAAPEPEVILDPIEETPLEPADRRTRTRLDAKEGTRVLIIDDSPTVIAAMKKILHSAGYVTFEALDAEAGLELARSLQPELIFLDIILPGMNGFAALRHMRQDPLTMHLPVIMISGNAHATEQFYANRIGADDFMKKPFSRYEVFARIERLLDAERVPRRIPVATEEVQTRATATAKA